MKIDYDQLAIDIKKGVYKVIGSGSGRRVYDIKKGYVVKMAKNKRGYAQNEAEYRIWKLSESSLLCRIYDVSSDYKFLIMDKAEKVKHLSTILGHFDVSSSSSLVHRHEVHDLIKRYSLMKGDIVRSASWGLINGRPVIVDYGFTKKVRNRYY